MEPPKNPDELAQWVTDLGLAERRNVEQALNELGVGEHSMAEAIRVFQRRGVITTLQAEKIQRGDRAGYFYGEYKVLYLIGAGTFARVYRASRGDDVFAVKVLRKRFRDEPKEMEQFLREGRMGLNLRHPNIVSIYDVIPDVRHPFLVMEFVEGQTLRELVRIRGKFPAKLALRLMFEIASGLAHAASLGISHRDLKLSNVLISADGKAKLVDFGLAALSDRNNPEQIADCPNARAIDYAALERGTGVRKDDPRSDIFFAGNMLYHMIAGQPALTETRDRLARLNITRFQEIQPLQEIVPDVPGIANQMVQRLMAFRPEERIQTAVQMREEIKRAIEMMERGKTASLQTNDGSGAPIEDEMPTNEGEGYVVMLVESKASLQNVIRERLKSRGYRVLIISDPNRALRRFEDQYEGSPADCIIFGASEMGELAVQAFNQFGSSEQTANIPKILLADQRQSHIIATASRGPNSALLSLPLRVRELRSTLLKLLSNVERRELGTY